MHYQLRRYEIEPGMLDDFAAAWRSGVVPLREGFGFHIHSGWAITETSEFLWIIAHEDKDAFEEADREYYSSQERRNLTPDPARFIVRTEKTTVAQIWGVD